MQIIPGQLKQTSLINNVYEECKTQPSYVASLLKDKIFWSPITGQKHESWKMMEKRMLWYMQKEVKSHEYQALKNFILKHNGLQLHRSWASNVCHMNELAPQYWNESVLLIFGTKNSETDSLKYLQTCGLASIRLNMEI